AAPDQSLPLLKSRLRPAVPADPQRLERWITDLDSNQFNVREKASQELEKVGEPAEPALRKALEAHSSPEVRRRVDQLLEKLELAQSPQRLQRLRAIEVLEHIGTPEAQAVLKALAKGAP